MCRESSKDVDGRDLQNTFDHTGPPPQSALLTNALFPHSYQIFWSSTKKIKPRGYQEKEEIFIMLYISCA